MYSLWWVDGHCITAETAEEALAEVNRLYEPHIAAHVRPWGPDDEIDEPEWFEKDVITAGDLLKAQDRFAENVSRAQIAREALREAIASIPRLEQELDGAVWDAECAQTELEQITQAIREQEEN